MANNNNGGGSGCSDIIGFISNTIRARNDASNYRRRLNQIEQRNLAQKSVITYNSSHVEAFVPRGEPSNIIISGDNVALRSRIMCVAAHNAYRNACPVIVLHVGNQSLVSAMTNAFGNSANFFSLNSWNRQYNPFLERSEFDISSFLFNAANNERSRIPEASRELIDAITDYLVGIGRPLTLSSYIDCMRYREFDRIEEMELEGHFSQYQAHLIKQRIRDNLSAIGSVITFLSNLQQQASTVLLPENSLDAGINIKSAAMQEGIIMIDVSNSLNNVFLNLLLEEINELIYSGRNFYLMIDSLSVSAEQALGRFFWSNAGMCKFVYSADDIYSKAQGNRDLVSTMLGKAHVFVLKHSSGSSAEVLSEFFGEYESIELNETLGLGGHREATNILGGHSVHTAAATHIVMRHCVEKYEIINLPANGIYIKIKNTDGIIRAQDSGRASPQGAPLPSPVATRTPTVRESNINWGLFALLFVLCYPLAFVHTFSRCGIRGKIISALLMFLPFILIIAANV